jgi:hypothetical protein
MYQLTQHPQLLGDQLPAGQWLLVLLTVVK